VFISAEKKQHGIVYKCAVMLSMFKTVCSLNDVKRSIYLIQEYVDTYFYLIAGNDISL